MSVETTHTTTAATSGVPELPDILRLLAELYPNNPVLHQLYKWENLVYSLFIISILLIITFFATRKMTLVPHNSQNAVEAIVEGIDNFICGIMGPQGRKYTPFIGTLFLYILMMNLSGLIPFLKSSTTSWSTTLALALIVFVCVQYTAIKQHGFFGYMYHLAGSPKGAMAWSIIFPIFMFGLHLLAELIRPLSLSLRLRSVMSGDETLLAVMAGFGSKGTVALIGGFFLLFLNMAMAVLTAVIQALVFSLLTTIYFVLALEHDE
ncbi:MAG: F0F1 ATP synthase subunit A [Candidatus Omnitrophica bacterium]|nr:F0F1 ATP synthase subunit A [Candidatus Omnitrophota bacterium]